MITKEVPKIPGLKWQATIVLINEESGEEVGSFDFEGTPDHIFEKINEVEAFAFSYMAENRCNMTSELKIAPLEDK